jgi:hypothetical protein
LWTTLSWWITSARRWMPRGKGFRDRLLVVTLIRVLVSSKVINRGLLLVSGIVVKSLSAISSRNVPYSSHRMATHALRSRVGIRLSVRALPIILPWRLVFLIPPTDVFDVGKMVTCLIIALRSPTSRLPRGRVVTRSLHLTLEGWTTCPRKQQWKNRKLCLVR